MLRSKVKLSILAVLFALFFAGVGSGITLAAQNHMINARNYLNSALSELNAAQADKGGHRANAIKYVQSAISEVNSGIQYAR